MVESFKKVLQENNMAENTIVAYLYAVNDFIGKYKVMNKKNLLLYKAELIERYKPKTVNLRILALNKYLDHISKSKLRLQSIKIQQRTYLENVISQADYIFLIRKLKKEENLMWYFVVRFLAATGARVSELIQIKVEHVSIGYLDLYTKGGKIRRLFIPKRLQKEAKNWILQSGITSGYLFLDIRGKQITPRCIGHKLKHFAKKYGLNPKVVYPHSFRHRFAKNFLDAYNDISLLADLMGRKYRNHSYIFKTNGF